VLDEAVLGGNPADSAQHVKQRKETQETDVSQLFMVKVFPRAAAEMAVRVQLSIPTGVQQ
jgi:hypothetical protein